MSAHVHRGPSPPKNPADGKRWRDTDARVTYVWRAGRGWIAEQFDRPPEGRRAEEAAELGIIPPERPLTLAEGGGFENAAGTHVSMTPRPGIDIPRSASGRRPGPQPDKRVAALSDDDLAFIRNAVIAGWKSPKIADEVEVSRAAVMLVVKRIRKELGIDGRAKTPAPPPPPVQASAPEAPIRAESVPKPAPPAPAYRPARHAEPDAPARAPVAASAPPVPRDQHPILERHAREVRRDGRPDDPLAKRGTRRKAAAKPEFSPEFLAKLRRVAEGAGIVTVQPISRVAVEMPAGGSSLSDA